MSAISVSWLSFSWGAVIFETNYGLMQHSHIEIKNKLLKALDEDYNVVDMATVFEVVSILEQLPITKEILEVTRLGKFVNQFRRKTQNEALAKRAKGLVRRWRNLMIPNEATVNETSQQNGTADHSAATSTATATTTTITSALTKRDENYELSSAATDQNSNNSSSSNNNNVSPYRSSAIVCSPQEPNVDAVPRTHAANKRLRKQELLLNKSLADEEDLSPRLKKRKINGLNNDTNFRARSSSPPLPLSSLRPSTPHRTAAAAVSNNASSPSTFNVLPNCAEQPPRVTATFGVSNVPSSVPTPVPSSPAPAITPPVVQIVTGSGSEPSGGTVYSTTIGGAEEPTPPTTARSKKRTKKADRKKCYDDDLREKLLGMTDSAKVKTTQELVNDLMNHDKARAADDSADTSLSNVLPLPRSPAIPSPPNFRDPPSTRSQRKNRSSASSEKHKQKHGNFNNNNGSAAAGNCDPSSVEAFPLSPAAISSVVNNKIDPNDKAAVILSGLPPLDLDSIVWSDEDELSETVGGEDGNGAVGKLVQDDAAHRRRTEYSSDGELLVEGVDGTYDEVDGQFKIWNEVVTRKTVKDELVYILPYTIID